jgi:hypothetical protein
MDLDLQKLELFLSKIKNEVHPPIKLDSKFSEYNYPKDYNEVNFQDLYANIKINQEENNQSENENDFLSFDETPPELFIENGLISVNTTKEKSSSMLDFVRLKKNDTYNLCLLNKCLELPSLFQRIFKDHESFYRYGVMKEFSFLHSLMCIIDPMYGSYTNQNKKSEIDCLYNKLLFEFPKMYDKYNYRKFGYKKGILQSKLSSDKKTDRSVQRYVSNYFNINILVVKIKYQKYYVCGDYDPKILSIIIINYEDTFEPIMSQYGNHYFKDAQALLEKEFTLEPSEEKKIMEISSNSEEEKQLKIKLFKKKKASEIYELCQKLDIKLEVGLGKKKKKKDDLITEIVACMD